MSSGRAFANYSDLKLYNTVTTDKLAPLYFQTPYFGNTESHPSQFVQTHCSGLLTLDQAYGTNCSNNWKQICNSNKSGFYGMPRNAGKASHEILNNL